MWSLLIACRREPVPNPEPTPGPAAHSAAAEPPHTGSGHTGGARESGGPVTEPFLSGEPADLIGQLELAWYPVADPTRWAVVATTFTQGSFGWTGDLELAADGLDSCEVRTGDPELELGLLDRGALEVRSGADVVTTVSLAPGAYFGEARLGVVDPRGRAWDLLAEGAVGAGFSLPAAVTFPAGELVVTEPAAPAVVGVGEPLRVRWTGTSAAMVELSLVGHDGSRVRCAAVDDGAFDVPASLLAFLPRGEVVMGVYARELAGPSAGDGAWVQVYATQAVEGSVRLQ